MDDIKRTQTSRELMVLRLLKNESHLVETYYNQYAP